MINFTKSLLILFVFALELQIDLFFEYTSPFSYSQQALPWQGYRINLLLLGHLHQAKSLFFSPLGIILENHICYSKCLPG